MRWVRAATGLQHCIQDRIEQVDRHEHVDVNSLAVEFLLHQQRADTDEIALGVEQGGAAPLRMRWGGEERFIEQIFPRAGGLTVRDELRIERAGPPAMADNQRRSAALQRTSGAATDVVRFQLAAGM